jgi:uncharacterized protein YjbI with pentapeptide repeats
MANENQLDLIRQEWTFWNNWRIASPNVRLDLSDAHLMRSDLSGADPSRVTLVRTDLTFANLVGTSLTVRSRILLAYPQP